MAPVSGNREPVIGRSPSTKQDGIRRGIGSVDYVLILGVILPAVAFCLWAGPRIIRLVYEMASVLVGWPFM